MFRNEEEKVVSAEEYAQFLHAVNSVYHAKYEGRKFGQIFVDNIYYRFELLILTSII